MTNILLRPENVRDTRFDRDFGGLARMGPRLRALLQLCPADGSAADVGSGHGRLALELKRQNPSRRVFATESSPGPEAELRRLLGTESGVQILTGEGLGPLQGLDCQGAVIAGMGGSTIAQMLRQHSQVTAEMEWLLLQPAQRSERLWEWLREAGWRLRHHHQVLEKAHLYQLFLVTPR